MKSQIVIVTEDGLSKPHFCCQHCGKVIKDASEANLVWDYDTPDQTTVICKSSLCEREQERHQGGDCWQPLEATWHYLKNNSGINEKQARDTAGILASL